jgi:hypothetical protein
VFIDLTPSRKFAKRLSGRLRRNQQCDQHYRYPSVFEPAVFAGWYGHSIRLACKLNSAESDSAVRCRHDEFES